MLLSETIEGNNYKITGHDLKVSDFNKGIKALDMISPGTAIKVVFKPPGGRIIIHLQGKRFNIPLSHTLKIRVNPI